MATPSAKKAGSLCEVCDYPLDRGRCAACMRVRPIDLEAEKFTVAYWSECSEHGALEAFPGRRGNAYLREWSERDPKDKRKKVRRSAWEYRCQKCDINSKATVTSHKEKITVPEHVWGPIIAERIEKFNAAAKRGGA